MEMKSLEAALHIMLKRRGLSRRMQGIVMGSFREACVKHLTDSDAVAGQGFEELDRRGFNPGRTDLSVDDMIGVYRAMAGMPPTCGTCNGKGAIPLGEPTHSEFVRDRRCPDCSPPPEVDCETCGDRKTVPSKVHGFVMDCPDCCGEEG